jgi:hypothetical protein
LAPRFQRKTPYGSRNGSSLGQHHSGLNQAFDALLF